MNLIIQKNSKYVLPEFFSKIINYDYIEGISLNVVKTNDNVLVVINLSTSETSYLKTIYSNSFVNLKGFEMIPLSEVMKYLKRINYKKKVFLDIIPYQPTKLTEEQNKLLTTEYKEYAALLKDVIGDDNILDIYIHSISRTLIDFIRYEEINAKFGFALVGFDLNYIDLDYYVFTVEMLNLPLIKQELEQNKMIIIYVGTEYELSYLYDIFKGDKKTYLTEEIFKNIYIMGDYPEILKEVFYPDN